MNGFQRTVARWLSEQGITWTEEYPCGPYRLDLYLPELRLAVEVDGKFFHGSRKDFERDANILNWFGIKTVRIPVGTRKAITLAMILGEEPL